MKTSFPVLGCLLALGLAGCSTVSSRISRNRAEYDTWPPAVQQAVASGKIGVGFTQQQVRVALGDPDRVFTRTTSDGTTEVWSYRDPRPRIGFGVGMGIGSGRGLGGGVMVGSGSGYRDDEKLGVIFDRAGKVSAIENRER